MPRLTMVSAAPGSFCKSFSPSGRVVWFLGGLLGYRERDLSSSPARGQPLRTRFVPAQPDGYFQDYVDIVARPLDCIDRDGDTVGFGERFVDRFTELQHEIFQSIFQGPSFQKNLSISPDAEVFL